MYWNGTRFVENDQETIDQCLPDNMAGEGYLQGPPAVTETVENLGAEQAQSIVHAPHTIYTAERPIAIFEASTAEPLRSAVCDFDFQGTLVNFIYLNPSAAQRDTYYALGKDIQWVNVSGVYLPIGDLKSAGDGSSTLVILPARRNWRISVVPWSNVLGEDDSDLVRLVYGYMPLGQDRWVLQ